VVKWYVQKEIIYFNEIVSLVIQLTTIRVVLVMLYITRNLTFHSRTKNIDVKYHFIREVVEDEIMELKKIHI